MNIQLVIHILGALALLISGAMLPSLGIAILGETSPEISLGAIRAFGLSIVLIATLGLVMRSCTRHTKTNRITASEGFAIAGLGWIFMAALGALPMYLCRNIAPGVSPAATLTFMDAYFESMSGFTTTGSSVFGTAASDGGLGAIQMLPRSFLFWRSLTHWIGGMGIVVLCLAILPALRAGGYQMFQAEVPGPTAERLSPRIRETAAVLWGVYLLLTALETLLLWLGNMPLFDSLCHTFGTMATGGFSTMDRSIGHYAATAHPNALYFEIIIDIFMFLAGCNFLLHFKALHGDIKSYFRDAEFRFFALILSSATLLTTLTLRIAGSATSFGEALRAAAFQVVSITTTTGFCTADFNAWPGICRALMVGLMFMGGCAGSTGGGIKHVRILVACKFMYRETLRLLRPRLANRISIGTVTLEERLTGSIIGLILLFGMLFTGATATLLIILSIYPLPNTIPPDSLLVTSTTAVAATLNNIGPGLSGVGATANFGWMPAPAKALLALCMLLGRLEVYSVIVILLPHTWRK